MDAQECVRSIGAVVPGCWELPDVVLNLDLLQEQQVSLTAERFLKSKFCFKQKLKQ